MLQRYLNRSSSYDEVLYRTWVVPAQLDMRFRLTKKEKSFLVFGGALGYEWTAPLWKSECRTGNAALVDEVGKAINGF